MSEELGSHSTGYGSDRRRIETVPFNGAQEEFPSWDFKFRIFANRHKCAPLLVPQLESSDKEEELENSNAEANQLLLELLVLSFCCCHYFHIPYLRK